MARNSKIEWTDHTVNLWWGCTKVHEGCDNCYAEKTSVRWGSDVWGNDKSRRVINKAFSDLAKYEKEAAAKGIKYKIFVGSMMDIFEKNMPLIDSKGEPILAKTTGGLKPMGTDHVRQLLFDLITRNKFDNLIFLFLTKRPSNIPKFIPKSWYESPPKNVWFGTSISNQKTTNDLLPKLVTYTPTKANRFLSVEPQLDFIRLAMASEGLDVNGEYRGAINHIDWIIQGGESGGGKRPFDLSWAQNMRTECTRFKIPYFFKQIDKIQPIPPEMDIKEFPTFER